MLELRDLNVHYDMIHAIKGISLTVEKGEIVTLIGANGAGKTTTLRTIAGLKKPTSGSVWLNGQDITETTPRQRVQMGAAMVPDGRHGVTEVTAQEKLELGLLPQPQEQAQADCRRPVGRRAADAGHGQGSHEPARNPLSRRALHGAFPLARFGNFCYN